MKNHLFAEDTCNVVMAIGFSLFGGLLLGALIRTGFLTGPLYGDETHFFSSTVSLIPFRLGKLDTLSEISSPTFFIAFSYALQLLGRSIVWCRLLVLLTLFGCVWGYHRTAAEIVRKSGSPRVFVHITWILLLTFPYFVGSGVYYYTDIPALFFTILAFGAHEKGRTGMAILWSTLALHCRQYVVFIPLGMTAFALWQWSRGGGRKSLLLAVAWLLPVLTFVPYLLFWGGFSPIVRNSPRLVELPLVMPWHVTYLAAACGLYLLPLTIWLGWRRWSVGKFAWVVAALLLFFIFPPRPNVFYELTGSSIRTLGFLDSALRSLFGAWGETALLAGGMGAAAVLHYELLIRGCQEDGDAFKWMVAAFWVMNAFSHLAWEKYLLPVLPLLYFLALRHPEAVRFGCSTRHESWSKTGTADSTPAVAA
jgi:hypothetical protein